MAEGLSICTWNIDRSGVRSKWRAAHQSAWLTSRQAGICVVTEVHGTFEIAGQRAVALSAEGKAPYASWEHAVGIWSSYPVLERIHVRDATHACCVALQTPVGPVAVYGTILPYRNAGLNEGLRTWQMHRLSLEQQIQDWENIRRTRPDDHLVVAGDFNMTMEPSNTYVDRPSRQRLLQACEHLNLICLTTHDTRAALGRSNIDHVLASRGLEMVGAVEFAHPATSVNAQPCKLSDHNAVAVTVAKRQCDPR